MIQKRFEYFTKEGKQFTPWFNYCENNGQLKDLQVNEKWQLKNKLLNEFRVI